MAIDNLPYITYNDFDNLMPKDLNTRERWNTLDLQGRGILYMMAHDVINYDFDYIGDELIDGQAFPRVFDYLICQTNKYNQQQIDLMTRYNRMIPSEIKMACLYLGQDLIKQMDYDNLLDIQRSTGAAQLSAPDIDIDKSMTQGSGQPTITRKYSYKSTKFIQRFDPVNFGLMKVC